MGNDGAPRRQSQEKARQELAAMLARPAAPLKPRAAHPDEPHDDPPPAGTARRSRDTGPTRARDTRPPRQAEAAATPTARRPTTATRTAEPRQADRYRGSEEPVPLLAPAVESRLDLQAARALRPIYDDRPRGGLLELPLHLLGLVALICAIVVWALWPSSGHPFLSGYSLSPAINGIGQPAAPAAVPEGEHLILGKPTISAEQVEAVLAKYGSPAAGTGQAWINLGTKYGIDPAYALAFFIHESSAGTNPNWAGLKGGGATTHNVGNIICAGYASCYGRFRDYPSWDAGIEDWYRLIAVEYVQGRNVSTLEQIIPIYAPSFENNVPAYVNAVSDQVNDWRRGVIR